MSTEGLAIIRTGDDRDAADVRDQLVAAGIDAEIVVAVKADQAEDAQRVLEGREEEADPSAELDLETIATFQGVDAEMQVAAVQGVLEQSGISVIVEGAYGLPSLPFEVKVASRLAGQAREVLAQAEAEGPAAADAATSTL